MNSLGYFKYPSEFIHFGYFYSASSSPLLLRVSPDTARILRVKDLPKVPTWRPERDSNPRPFGRKATNLPMSHHDPQGDGRMKVNHDTQEIEPQPNNN